MATDIKPSYWCVELPQEKIYIPAASVGFTETHVLFYSQCVTSQMNVVSQVERAILATRVLSLKRMPDGWEG